ncbi:NUDIX domain-containing protein [Phenylobacterium sp.]|jgi:8-oxo-dGTP diphosphatase|uniref:NUDIX domain-containing protein n=1 Tax=Phenylobacterium sp. TaxID=1871053 RepID=UPI002E349D0A|nr:NUDIX domain-containing protein [Phenylobacterium sp.]HEX2559159.1 NUDIX domain-containing protein [Phenylobacterium sp.]
MAVPQFGEPAAGREHRDRPAAFGIAVQDGKIALVRVEKPGHEPWLDLPGGAIDPGENEAQALVREFGEETGLAIEAGQAFARGDQYFVNTDGEAFNNRAGFWTVAGFSEAPQLKIEDDHTLVWLDPHEALARLRHDAHAWSVAAWLRRVAPRARGG